ncbi:hypothetical protein Tco_1135052 [Tanacetum coccineum]
MATLNESFHQGTGSGSGPRCQDTILGDAKAQIRALNCSEVMGSTSPRDFASEEPWTGNRGLKLKFILPKITVEDITETLVYIRRSAAKDKAAVRLQEQLDEEERKRIDKIFKDMLKSFDRDDLLKLWSLVQERFNSTDPTEDKEIELWVELKRLFEPGVDDELWKS